MRAQAQAGHPPVSQPPAGHLPVLYAQTLAGLRVIEDGTYLDGTFGRGGHAGGVLRQLGPEGRLLVMDKDPEAIAVAERDFAQSGTYDPCGGIGGERAGFGAEPGDKTSRCGSLLAQTR